MNPRSISKLIALTVVLVVPIQTVLAEDRFDQWNGGLRPVVPFVPQQLARPSEGDAEDRRWRIQRPEEENEPVASYIDSLKGNDAAFHVTVGQGRLLTTREPLAMEDGDTVIAVGDPTVIDFEVLPNPRMIRIIGRRPGITDLSITTAEGQAYNFEIHVGYDLKLIGAQLRQIFPDAHVKLGQMGSHLVVEGQARSSVQVDQILQAIEAHLAAYLAQGQTGGTSAVASAREAPDPVGPQNGTGNQSQAYGPTMTRSGQTAAAAVAIPVPRIINLLRVPGVQQVMLQVRIAELNRTALREIGTDLKLSHGNQVVGTQISNANATDILGFLGLGGGTTAFGVFEGGDFQIFLRALRENAVLNILAEPNLIAMNGHQASFLAGGQFPVPVPQASGGISNSITVQFKDFGVQLDFLPFILDDERIRLKVEPEASSIDFSLGTTLVPGGDPVPGLNTRKVATTVELREGQTLAIAGLLQVTLDAQTDRIPGIGDLPVLGPLFSNTTHKRQEKELLVLVTPYLVRPLQCDQLAPLPGEEVTDPTDLEFYFMSRIEGRKGQYFRAPTAWDHTWENSNQIQIESQYFHGEVGFSE